MLPIYCSHKLAKFLGVKNKNESTTSTHWAWNAHLFSLDGRKCLIFVEKESLYTVASFDVLKKDLKDFQAFFVNHFLAQLTADKILTDSIKDLIINDFKEINLFITNNDKPIIGYINDCVARLKWLRQGIPLLESAKWYMQNHFHKIPLGMREYKYANELIQAKFEQLLKGD